MNSRAFYRILYGWDVELWETMRHSLLCHLRQTNRELDR